MEKIPRSNRTHTPTIATTVVMTKKKRKEIFICTIPRLDSHSKCNIEY